MRGLLFLLSALFLLESTDGHKEYHQLSPHEKNIIDRAIQLANEKHGKTKHLDFAYISKADFYSRMVVILKPTSCDKTTPNVHRKDCKIQDKARPQVSCVDCRGSMSCLRSFREKDKIKETLSACSRSHLYGEGHPMALSIGNEQELDVWDASDK